MLAKVKASLTRKLGPLPAWAWLGIVGVGAFLYMRRGGGSQAPAETGLETPPDVGRIEPDSGLGGLPASGGGAPGGSEGVATPPPLDSGYGALEPEPQASVESTLDTLRNLAEFTDELRGPGPSQSVGTDGLPSAPSGYSGKGFGGIVNTERLANGSVLYTYASGRQVQQAPGKRPYVVKFGSEGQPKPAKPKPGQSSGKGGRIKAKAKAVAKKVPRRKAKPKAKPVKRKPIAARRPVAKPNARSAAVRKTAPRKQQKKRARR